MALVQICTYVKINQVIHLRFVHFILRNEISVSSLQKQIHLQLEL